MECHACDAHETLLLLLIQLQSLLDDMHSETDVLRSQISTERSSVKSLEGLLASNREREFQNQMTAQEMAAEVQLMKDRLALNDSKIDSQNRELATTRTRTIELESEIERMRRQLTSERFERQAPPSFPLLFDASLSPVVLAGRELCRNFGDTD